MAGRLEHLRGVEHLGLGAEAVLVLAVVEPGLAAHHDQDHVAVQAQRQGLGDPRRRDAVRRGGEPTVARARRRLEDLDVGGALGEEGAN